MNSSDTTTTTTFNHHSSYSYSSSPPSSSSSPPTLHPSTPPPLVLSPCAACKILRRRCVDKCVLAPYFPPNEPLKFTTAHRVFGASNIIKFLQELPESQRADAVSSMVYEANARIRDPVYGCAGAICHLQKQVGELQAELARARAELVNMQAQQSNLVAIICMEMAKSQQYCAVPPVHSSESSPDRALFESDSFLLDDANLSSVWEESLWT
ncbi:LOB domain-containing protein 1 [Iris pallida]|uniref:LOB domain-containing protein 1 n=1 Tax=Iris pallida TaxID=29817 RepID=A0AAX6GA27_IRIPA|nr:LOB domain-containing protein 1 [Iris pallida]